MANPLSVPLLLLALSLASLWTEAADDANIATPNEPLNASKILLGLAVFL